MADDPILDDIDDIFSVDDADLEVVTETNTEASGNVIADIFSSIHSFAVFSSLRFGEVSKKSVFKGLEDAVILDVLDELTEGQASKTLEVKRMERELLSLVYFQATLIKINKVMDEEDPATANYIDTNARNYARFLANLVEFSFAELQAQYLQYCEENNFESQIENIINDGVLYTKSINEIKKSNLTNFRLIE